MCRQHQQVSDSRYHYDPLGRRIRKVVTGHDPQTATSHIKSTDFLWQGLRLLSEMHHRSEQPDITRVYCYEQNSYAPLARIDTTGDDLNTPQVYYFHTDVTGTPKEVTDTNGQIVWQADYTAWGEIDLYRVHQIDQPLRFQGQYADDETGLYYTTFRCYDPHAGRFTTQDPIGLAGGSNLYQYAPNPTGWVDPWGLSCGKNETYYRTMSRSDFEHLQQTGNLRPTSETFVSPTQSFSEGYSGILVRFELKEGTTDLLKNIGVRDVSKVTRGLTEMPFVHTLEDSWKMGHAYFKGERG